MGGAQHTCLGRDPGQTLTAQWLSELRYRLGLDASQSVNWHVAEEGERVEAFDPQGFSRVVRFRSRREYRTDKSQVCLSTIFGFSGRMDCAADPPISRKMGTRVSYAHSGRGQMQMCVQQQRDIQSTVDEQRNVPTRRRFGQKTRLVPKIPCARFGMSMVHRDLGT
jgi:hypothetical protein